MTPTEARALFPVLDRLAYLNAGTFGPVARPTADAVRAQLDDELEHGRFGKQYFERMLGLRAAARAALGPGIDHVLVRGLTASPLTVWPVDRRRQSGAVLSDHAPVEVTVS